jgi:hypothetical protein
MLPRKQCGDDFYERTTMQRDEGTRELNGELNEQ